MCTKTALFFWILLSGYLGVCQPDLKFLDGKIEGEELSEFKEIGSNGITSVYLDNERAYLRISLKSEKLHVASLCLCTGDKVMVLHASAALGRIDYDLGAFEEWTTQENFEYGMRSAKMDDESMGMRSDYLRSNGWVATTMRMGTDGEVEFIIDRSLLPGNSFYLAAGLMPESDPESIISLPQAKAGDCAAYSLVQGSPEPKYRFNPKSWYKISLEEL